MTLSPFCNGLIIAAVLVGVFLLACSIARAARDVPAVDEGQSFGGEYDAGRR